MAIIGIEMGTSNSAAAGMRNVSRIHTRNVLMRGDLYLWGKVHIPEHLTPSKRELYDKLRSLACQVAAP